MVKWQLIKFLKFLHKDSEIIAPICDNSGVLTMQKIDDVGKINLSNNIPLQSFKKFLLPQTEILAKGNIKDIQKPLNKAQKMVFAGLTIPDLRAITVLNQVFEKDPYYQNKMKNLLIIGYSEFPCEYKGLMAGRYEEDILEHIQFDIFIVHRSGHNRYKILSGSEDGQRILDKFGYKKYDNVQFSGPIKEEGAPKKLAAIKKAIKNSSPKDNVFKEIGVKCLECGKCSLICPLCFCFCLDDKICINKNKLLVNKERHWTTCFYSEFSEIAGGHKFLNNPAERIYNWYEHKFVRIPDELSLMGCVGCGRCAKVCPAGIDIKDVLHRILKKSPY